MTLTNSDKSWIKNLLQDGLESQEEKFEAKLTEFKSEFFDKVDPILKEVVTAREERPLIEDRIQALEKIHPQGKHAAAI